jgi:putative thioredoxin
MTAHIIEVNAGNFNAAVIQGSKRNPVVIDFWAPWCAPCHALTPILEKLATEYQGKFTLAKVNSDENQELAAQFGVRGIPSVKAVVDGEIIDEFSGALPEPAVRAFIERIVPSPAEERRREAMAAYGRDKDAESALDSLINAAALDPNNEAVIIDRAAILIDLGRYDEARSLIDALAPLTQMDERVVALMAQLDLAAGAAAAPSEGTLVDRIAKDSGDLAARLQLAQLKVARKDYQAALEQLLEIVKRDRAFKEDIARKTMLQVFSLLGSDSELTSEYRRRLASAMY